MKATEILKRLMTEMTSVEVKFERMALENGTIFEAEKFEGGNEIFIVTDEARIAVPVGDYALEDGRVIVVSEEGIIERIDEKREEEVEVEVPVEEVEVEASEAAPKKVIESQTTEKHFSEKDEEDKMAVVEDWEGMEKRIQNLEDAVANLKRDKVEASSEIEELKAKNQELSAESATKPIKHNPENAQNNEVRDTHRGPLTSFERVLNNLNK
tara:strand:+ start:1854 stop:2489 length:636 start_codon:yes stop_codon:yes gene_type:complete